MKRILVLLVTLLVAIPLALGAVAGLSYYTTSADTVPSPVIKAMETQLTPTGYEWRQPVFGGLIYRDFSRPAADAPTDLGQLNEPIFPLEVPDGYDAKATVTQGDQVVWKGRVTEMQGYQFLHNGNYHMLVECSRNNGNGKGYGTVLYNFTFTVKVEPRYDISDDWVEQGNILAIRVYNLTEGMVPEGSSDLGELLFLPTGHEGQMVAYLPVGYDRETGGYIVKVQAGQFKWEIPIRVTQTVFELRTKGAEGSKEASNVYDPLAYKEYYELVQPLLEQHGPDVYWTGSFITPVKGQVTTPYGLYLTSNGKTVMSRHPGIDYKANEGTSVFAPNNGQVVFAGELPTAGNTVIIEHGGGLKTIFQHLDRMDVKAGDMVEKGQEIATVGETGDANYPHLHYEVRLLGVAVSPALLEGGHSGLYYYS